MYFKNDVNIRNSNMVKQYFPVFCICQQCNLSHVMKNERYQVGQGRID